MTKQQAIELESEIDEIFSKALETECTVSMALTGAFRVETSNGFINIRNDNVDWVKWSGDYDMLQDMINKSMLTFKNNKGKIETLLNTYCNTY